MSVTLRKALPATALPGPAVKYDTSRELVFAALTALILALGSVAVEIATKSIYLSGFCVVALLAASAGFLLTSQLTKHR